MTRASLAAFRQTVTVAWPQAMDEGARRHLIAVAKRGHAANLQRAAAATGGTPQVESYANRPGNPVESVVLPGPIVYRYRYRQQAIRLALAALRDASPARSGKYRDSHTLFIDGVPVSHIPARLPAGAEVMIANPVPYARRLEIGKTKSGRSFVLQVPDAIYERVAKRVLQPRFGAIAQFRFGYVTLPGAWTVKGRLSATYLGSGRKTGSPKVERKRRQRIGEKVQAPAIFIEMPRAA